MKEIPEFNGLSIYECLEKFENNKENLYNQELWITKKIEDSIVDRVKYFDPGHHWWEHGDDDDNGSGYCVFLPFGIGLREKDDEDTEAFYGDIIVDKYNSVYLVRWINGEPDKRSVTYELNDLIRTNKKLELMGFWKPECEDLFKRND